MFIPGHRQTNIQPVIAAQEDQVQISQTGWWRFAMAPLSIVLIYCHIARKNGSDSVFSCGPGLFMENGAVDSTDLIQSAFMKTNRFIGTTATISDDYWYVLDVWLEKDDVVTFIDNNGNSAALAAFNWTFLNPLHRPIQYYQVSEGGNGSEPIPN